MKDILEGVFANSIGTMGYTKEYENRVKEFEDKLWQVLNEEEKYVLLEYANAHFDFVYDCSIENFRRGFWLGFELMRELQEN